METSKKSRKRRGGSVAERKIDCSEEEKTSSNLPLSTDKSPKPNKIIKKNSGGKKSKNIGNGEDHLKRIFEDTKHSNDKTLNKEQPNKTDVCSVSADDNIPIDNASLVNMNSAPSEHGPSIHLTTIPDHQLPEPDCPQNVAEKLDEDLCIMKCQKGEPPSSQDEIENDSVKLLPKMEENLGKKDSENDDNHTTRIIDPNEVSCSALTQPFVCRIGTEVPTSTSMTLTDEENPIVGSEPQKNSEDDKEVVFKQGISFEEIVKSAAVSSDEKKVSTTAAIHNTHQTLLLVSSDELNDLTTDAIHNIQRVSAVVTENEMISSKDGCKESTSLDDFDMTDSQFMSVDIPLNNSHYKQKQCNIINCSDPAQYSRTCPSGLPPSNVINPRELPQENICQIDDGTKIVKDLISEVSFLNKLILKTKRELESSRRKLQPPQIQTKTIGVTSKWF